MKLLRVFPALAALVLSGLMQPAQIQPVHAQSSPTNSHGNGLINEQQRRQEQDQQYLKEHTDRSGKIDPTLMQRGIAQTKQMHIAAGISVQKKTGASTPSLAAPLASSVTGVQWTQVGPAPLRIDAEQNFQGSGPDSGQVTDIAIDPRNSTDSTIYIASNDGGIWKSTDGGSTWQPKTDFMPSLSMGAVALDPSNPSIVYAGTGNAFNNGFFLGVGIYKSTDGGDTWTVLGGSTLKGKSIRRIVVTASGILLVATGSGLFRSVDGGLNFGSNSPLFNNGTAVLSGSIDDLKLDTTTAGTVYATAAGQGLFVSTDSGATFSTTKLFSSANLTGLTTPSLGYLSFAQSTTPNNQTMYVSVQTPSTCSKDTNGNFIAGAICAQVYRSTNGGTSWTDTGGAEARSLENGGCQCGYDQTIGVDPQDATRVYIGYQELYLSTDSGGTFGTPAVSRNQVHWDHHAVVFSPQPHWGGGGAPTRVYVGTDGGIADSSNGGTNWSNLNEGIATNLFRGIDIGRGSTANNGYSYGGTQDTGVIEHRPAFTGADWHLGIDGDGGPVATDPCNASHTTSTDDGGYVQTTDAGATWGGGTGFPAKSSVGVVAFDPNCGVAYAANYSGTGGNTVQLFQSIDNGATWSAMHSFSTAGNAITAFGTDKLDSNTLWLGFNDGTVQRTANALLGATSTWTSMTIPGAPGAPVGGIALDPSNTAQAVVGYTGFCGFSCPAGTSTLHAFMTSNNGTNWTDVSGSNADATKNLPDLPLHSVVIDPGTTPHTIIVSSDAAVMRSADNGSTWQVLGFGLPTVDATSLQIDPSASPSLLRIGTYGRSVFELTAATGPLLAVNANLAFGTVPVGGNATSIMQLFNVGSTDLHISSIGRVSGSTDFSIISGPATPVTLTPGEELDYTVQFAPTVVGNEQASFQINSDDPNHPAYTVNASGTGGGPKMAVSGSLAFGTVARGTTATRDITVFDTGNAPLTISSVAFDLGSDGSFSVLGPSTPQTIAVGDHISFTVQFAPPSMSTGALRTGTLRIKGFDALFPSLTVPDATVAASGTPGVPVAGVSSTALQFGNVAVDDRTTPYYSDQTLTISNQASCALCTLNVNALTITGPNASEFSLQTPPSPPITVGAGNTLTLTIRFNPIAGGVRNATLTISTDDPVNPTFTVSLTGTGLLPGISSAPSPLIFGPTVFDPVCSPTCGANANEVITNNGQTELILDALTFTGAAFSGPGPTVPPSRVPLGNSYTEVVTFHPTGAPARKVSGNLHVQDNVNGEGPIVSQDIPLCGESVGRGIRVLVKDNSGNTVSNVNKLSLQSHGITNPINVNLKDAALTTINPPTSCQQIQFHYENQTLQATGSAANPGSYYSLTATVGSKHATLSFTLGLNEFKQITLTVQ
jgi:hypothetical protein